MNKQYSVNRNNIYRNITSNLNLKSLHVNNGVYKIVQPITDELENFVSYTNSLMNELNPLTASYNTLIKMGAELGVYRQYYNEIQLDASSGIVLLVTDPMNIFTTQDVGTLLLFKEGDSYSFGTYSIIFLKDVYMSDTTLSVKIVLQNNSSLSIEESTLLTLTPTVNYNTVKEVQLLFSKPISLFNIQESVEDFRTKIIKAKNSRYFNRNKSIDLALSEVPGIFAIEIDRKENNAFSNIYIYTEKLLTDGQDSTISPLLTTSFSSSLNKYLEDIYQYQVTAATPLSMTINIASVNNHSEDYLKSLINSYITRLKTLSIKDVADFLNNYLALNISEESITFALKSDSIFENDINLDKTLLLELPPGRFFYVSNIKKV